MKRSPKEKAWSLPDDDEDDDDNADEGARAGGGGGVAASSSLLRRAFSFFSACWRRWRFAALRLALVFGDSPGGVGIGSVPATRKPLWLRFFIA